MTKFQILKWKKMFCLMRKDRAFVNYFITAAVILTAEKEKRIQIATH